MEVSGQFHAPAALPTGETAPGTHWLGGWVGPIADLDVMEKRKILPLPGIEPRLSSLQPVAIPIEPTTYY
jgi:hypothetical protein